MSDPSPAPPPPPFGIILPSRPVLINPVTISPTQFAFTFPSSPHFSHIVVFLLPGTSLPDGMLAGVYIQLPSSGSSMGQGQQSGAGFQLLGAIGSEKPSAIFEVNAATTAAGRGQSSTTMTNGNDEDEMTDTSTASLNAGVVGEVTVGLSIEPAQSITAQSAALKATSTASQHIHNDNDQSMALVTSTGQAVSKNALTTKVLAQRIIKNAFNFLASFAGSSGPGGQEVVPLKSFQDWWTKFERRIQLDPGFLERDDQD